MDLTKITQANNQEVRSQVVVVMGTRPEIIKLSPVILVLWNHFKVTIVHTGQHFSYEMDKIFFEELGLPEPQFRLEVGAGSHGVQTGLMLARLDNLFQQERPSLVIVQGDTNSTLAGALAAVKLHLPVAHVEAGCRSYNRAMPEEINRVLVDQISDFLFTPDATATNNLRMEGISPGRIFEVGSTGVEACRQHAEKARKLHFPEREAFPVGRYLLVTLHRAETADNPERLGSILNAVNQLSKDVPLVIPIHPRTRKRMEEGGFTLSTSVHILPPLGYLEFMSLLLGAQLVMTDSGGVQEEAATLHIPFLVLREETEWQEYVDRGQARLVGWREQGILEAVEKLLKTPMQLANMRAAGEITNKEPSTAILNILEAWTHQSDTVPCG